MTEKQVVLKLRADEVVQIPLEVPTDWDHGQLDGRDREDSHPIEAITGLSDRMAKLDGIEAGAQANVIERITRNGVIQEPVGKVVDIAVPDSYGWKLELDEQGRIFLLDPAGVQLSMVDTGLERIIKTGYYDDKTQELVLVMDDDNVIRVPVSGLVDVYTADEATLTLIDKQFSLSPTSKQQIAQAMSHIGDKQNPHGVTKAQVGLGNVDNTADSQKPVSTAQQAALDKKADKSLFDAHVADGNNPHLVTKSQVGLGNVDNTSDMDKPVSTAQQAALNKKQDEITGAASTITDQDLGPDTVLVSSPQGKVAASGISVTELEALDGIRSGIQAQIDSKQGEVTGGASSIVDVDLTPAKVLVSDGLGKVAVSAVTSSELLTLQGIEGNIQEALNAKVDKVAGKQLSTEDYTTAEKTKLEGIASGAQVNVLETVKVNGSALPIADRAVDVTMPTKVSDLENDSGFVTKIVSDLTNYYTKSETYTKAEIQNLVNSLPEWKVIKVQSLPTSDIDTMAIYLVPKGQPNADGDDSYDEYIYIDGAWEYIGTTAFSLNIIQSIDGITINDVVLQDASATQDGLMTKEMVVSLNGKADSSAVVPNTRTVNGKALSSDISLDAVDVGALPSDTHIPDDVTIEQTFDSSSPNPPSCSAVYQLIVEAGESIGLQAHVSDLQNPHQVTKAQVGLSDVDNTSDLAKPISTATQAALNNKVDKVSGKGLSTEDYTTTEKTKLSGIASGAQVNVIETVKVNGAAVQVTDKAVDISVPTDTADLTNGAGFQTSADVQSAISGKAESSALSAHTSDLGNPHNVTKAQVGLGNVDNTADLAKPVSTAQQTALDGKVDKVSGKQLSTEDYTSAEKTKLADLYTKAELDQKFANLPDYTPQRVDELPASGEPGVMYLVPKEGDDQDICDEYLWTNGAWELVGSTRFSLEIVQGSAGISINGTALQEASSIGAGLMTPAQVSTLAGAATSAALNAHIANQSNPHNVTKAQVGLDQVDNTSDLAKPVSTAQQTALNGKVDKVTGKGLSTNDFTTELYTKLTQLYSKTEIDTMIAQRAPKPTEHTIAGDGSTKTFPIQHNLGYLPKFAIYKMSGAEGEWYLTDVKATTTTLSLSFYNAPASGDTYKVVI